MKVKELIAQLQECDPEAVVCEFDPVSETPAVRHYELVEISIHKNRSYYDEKVKVKSGDIVVIL